MRETSLSMIEAPRVKTNEDLLVRNGVLSRKALFQKIARVVGAVGKCIRKRDNLDVRS